jgi:hypothetical protein
MASSGMLRRVALVRTGRFLQEPFFLAFIQSPKANVWILPGLKYFAFFSKSFAIPD